MTANDLKSNVKAELIKKLNEHLFPRINLFFLSG